MPVPLSQFQAQLQADAERTQTFLETLFTGAIGNASPRLVEAMAYSVLNGGKRIRAALVLGAARLTSKVNNNPNDNDSDEVHPAVQVAAAFECLHAYSLIHDDLPAMDDSGLRRGKPACHIAFDEASAILAGGALQSLAFELLADPAIHEDAEIRATLIAELAKASGAAGMAGGQMLDLEAEQRRFSLDETKAMQAMKTGALIRAAARAGGIIAKADATLLDGFDGYANAIGLAFQIADDALDRSHSSAELGKPSRHDKSAGKASLVDQMGVEKAAEEAARLVDEAIASLSSATTSMTSATQELDYMLELATFVIKRNY